MAFRLYTLLIERSCRDCLRLIYLSIDMSPRRSMDEALPGPTRGRVVKGTKSQGADRVGKAVPC